jgi:hypothetical protein
MKELDSWQSSWDLGSDEYKYTQPLFAIAKGRERLLDQPSSLIGTFDANILEWTFVPCRAVMCQGWNIFCIFFWRDENFEFRSERRLGCSLDDGMIGCCWLGLASCLLWAPMPERGDLMWRVDPAVPSSGKMAKGAKGGNAAWYCIKGLWFECLVRRFRCHCTIKQFEVCSYRPVALYEVL